MRTGNVMDDFAREREDYVARVRSSFDTAYEKEQEQPEDGEIDFWGAAKIRFLLSLVLLIGFLYCKYTDTAIFGHSTGEITDMAEDNHYMDELNILGN